MSMTPCSSFPTEYSDFPLHAWSLRRHRMLEMCPRCALLHYRDSRLGIHPDATARERLLYRLRNQLPLRVYVKKLLRETMRDVYYSIPAEEVDFSESVADFTTVLLKRFAAAFEKMLRGTQKSEEKFYFIRELFDHHCQVSEIASEGRRELCRAAEMLNNGSWRDLMALPQVSRRYISSPLEVCINELRCYCAPLCAAEMRGQLWIIETGSADDRVALLHKFYALNTLGRNPEQVRSFVLDDETGEIREFGRELDISAALRDISNDDGKWAEILEFKTDEVKKVTENCQLCNFRTYCNY